jgi:hypothetical protein
VFGGCGSAVYAATTCEEMRFPWARAAPPDPARESPTAAPACTGAAGS